MIYYFMLLEKRKTSLWSMELKKGGFKLSSVESLAKNSSLHFWRE